MPQSIREVMTADPVSLSATTSLTDAARRMRDEDIGDALGFFPFALVLLRKGAFRE